MELRFLCSLLFVGVFSVFGRTGAANWTSLVCLKRTLNDVAALQEDLSYPHLCKDDYTPRVLQVSGRYVNEALLLSGQGNPKYIAVLFYVEWCPFSRDARRMLDQLSVLFPAISHIAVESSGLWPSELSDHGIRSLPALFVHEKALRYQFYGSRSVQSISQFYKEKTGLAQLPLSYSFDDGCSPSSPHKSRNITWGSWFVVWLLDDIYLGFAVFFLILRSLWYAQPKIAARLRCHWVFKEMSWKGPKGAGRQVRAERRQRVAPITAKSKGKCLKKDDKDSGKAVLSVPSWPSSSFAAVALGECSSIDGATEDLVRKSIRGA